MPRDDFNFRSGEAISQQKGIFAVEGHFRSPFCSPFRNCEIRSGGCEMALVCQGVVLQLRNPLRNGAMAVKMGFSRLWGFRRAFRSYEMRRGCEMALVCQGVVSQLRKFSQRESMGLRNHFAANGRFRSQGLISQRASWGCKIIS